MPCTAAPGDESRPCRTSAPAPTQAERGLATGEIHVTSACLDLEPDAVSRLRRLLSDDELERAGRFRFARDRDRYVTGRAELRRLLSGYLGVPPWEIVFTYSELRKPAVSSPFSTLTFNVSHSGSLVLYAFCLGADIGIDVEERREDVAEDRVPEHFFSAREVRTLRSLPRAAQSAGFLRCWTRKEAFLKARGDGLTLPLDSFDVTLTEHEPARLLRTAWDPAEAGRWSIHDLTESFPGFVAALAVEGMNWSVTVLGDTAESCE